MARETITFTRTMLPEETLTSINPADIVVLDKPPVQNMSLNSTIPWHNQTAMQELIQQWVRFENLPPIAPWWIFVGFMHVALGMITILLRYPLWQVVYTMAVIEAPQTIFRNDRRLSTGEKSRDSDIDTSAVVTHERPTTSSLRNALRHIYRLAGWTSFYRAMAITLCYNVVGVFIYSISLVVSTHLVKLIPIPSNVDTTDLKDFAANVLCAFLLCQWDTAHTHILITSPTLRIWYRRLPPFWKTLKSTWLPLLVNTAAHKITFTLPYYLCSKAGLYTLTTYLGPLATGNALHLRRLTFVAIWLVAQLLRLELLLPAGIAIIRVETSLLPDDEDTIVPVDRTFATATSNGSGSGSGGRGGYAPRPPGILTPSRGAISFRGAWKSYDMAERKRLLWLFAKMVLVEAVIRAGFWLVIGDEVWPRFCHPQL